MKGGALATVRRVSDERAYLYQIIQTIGSGPDLDAILRGVIQLVTEATACHACFIYFVKDDRLQLRAASSMYSHLEGQVEIPVGEGLTGWAVRSRRSAFIREGALDDPRVRRAYFPELGDEHYQSLVTVPMFSRSGEVIGAITLHAEAPHEFAPDDLDFLEHTASLIAGAVDNARLYEQVSARVDLLTALTRLSQRIAWASGIGEVLAAVTEGTRALLDADTCEIYLTDPDGLLVLSAADPQRSPGSPLDDANLRSGSAEHIVPPEEARRIATVLWGETAAPIPLFAPMVAGDERLGLIGVLLSEPGEDAESALLAIASHAAVAVKQHQLIDSLTEKNLVKDFFQVLSRPDADRDAALTLARSLGCDVDAPHLVVCIVPASVASLRAARRRGPAKAGPDPLPWVDVAEQAVARLAARFPGTLIDQLERSIRALVPVVDDSATATVEALRSIDWGGSPSSGTLAVGVSNPCRGTAAYPEGFQEAEAAAEVGSLIRGASGVTTYEDLGPYRYVLSTDEGLRDRYQQRLERLVEYDARRGTELLDTLEGYLDHRGSVVTTSRALYIHPNTLRQRLKRIEHSSGIDLDRDDWLSLAVATKIVKLRWMRRQREALGNTEGGKGG